MKIAIIGAGNVGTALGSRLSKLDHYVRYGVRSEKKLPAIIPPGHAIPVEQAIREAELVFLTVPWSSAKDVAEGTADWQGKILVDCTNPIKADFSGLEIGHSTSGAEMVQAWAKGARVVKCFNQTGFENLAYSGFGANRPLMYAAGDEAAALRIVAGMAELLGFEVIPLPSLSMARQLEQLAWLWIYTAFKTPVGRGFAFGVLRKQVS